MEAGERLTSEESARSRQAHMIRRCDQPERRRSLSWRPTRLVVSIAKKHVGYTWRAPD